MRKQTIRIEDDGKIKARSVVWLSDIVKVAAGAHNLQVAVVGDAPGPDCDKPAVALIIQRHDAKEGQWEHVFASSNGSGSDLHKFMALLTAKVKRDGVLDILARGMLDLVEDALNRRAFEDYRSLFRKEAM